MTITTIVIYWLFITCLVLCYPSHPHYPLWLSASAIWSGSVCNTADAHLHSSLYPWKPPARSLVSCATAVSLPEVCCGLKGRSSAQRGAKLEMPRNPCSRNNPQHLRNAGSCVNPPISSHFAGTILRQFPSFLLGPHRAWEQWPQWKPLIEATWNDFPLLPSHFSSNSWHYHPNLFPILNSIFALGGIQTKNTHDYFHITKEKWRLSEVDLHAAV